MLSTDGVGYSWPTTDASSFTAKLITTVVMTNVTAVVRNGHPRFSSAINKFEYCIT